MRVKTHISSLPPNKHVVLGRSALGVELRAARLVPTLACVRKSVSVDELLGKHCGACKETHTSAR